MRRRAPARAAVRIGCSGWNYRHWRGAFYPEDLPLKRWFSYYADHFGAVEINNSFYRLPAPDLFGVWRERAPEDFRYAVKANRFITQAKKLKDCEEPLARMLSAARYLGPTLGPLLYQLPPSLRLDLERLEAFLKLLPSDLTHVFEFRDTSWYIEETRALLDRFGAGFVVHDFPGKASPRWTAGDLVYVRFHGGAGKYVGRYSESALRGCSDWLIKQAQAGRPIWAFFNNDSDAAAVSDALALEAMIGESSAARQEVKQ